MKEKGNTAAILTPFLDGMREASAEIELFYIKSLKIKLCQGEFNCWFKTPAECFQKDDMRTLLPKFSQADLWVFATPLYVDGMSGPMKNLLDRLIPLLEPFLELRDGHGRHPLRKGVKRGKVVLVSNCGLREIQLTRYDPHALATLANELDDLGLALPRERSSLPLRQEAFGRFSRSGERVGVLLPSESTYTDTRRGLMLPHKLRKPILRLAWRRAEAAARRQVQENTALWPLLEGYLAKTESTGCQYVDYDVLYRRIRASKPREVLECGTGVSTVVAAQALRENDLRDGVRGRVTSMENMESWYEMATRLLPDELRDYAEIRLSPKVEDGYTIFRGVRYAEIPDRRYELVFVDGPGTLAPSDGTRCFDFDFLHVVRRAEHPVFGIVDGRLTTCYVLQKIFGPEKFRFDVYRNLGYVGPCTRHDMRTITRSSSIALAHSRRLVGPTHFRLVMEPPGAATPSDKS